MSLGKKKLLRALIWILTFCKCHKKSVARPLLPLQMHRNLFLACCTCHVDRFTSLGFYSDAHLKLFPYFDNHQYVSLVRSRRTYITSGIRGLKSSAPHLDYTLYCSGGYLFNPSFNLDYSNNVAVASLCMCAQGLLEVGTV